MVMALPDKDTSAWMGEKKKVSIDNFQEQGNTKRRVRKQYKRKRIPETERERLRLSKERQSRYEQIMSNAGGEAPSIWGFESLFPKTVWDDATIKKDLFELKIRDGKVERERQGPKPRSKLKTSAIGASSMMRVWREPKLSSSILPYDPPPSVFETPKKEVEGDLTGAEAESRIFEQTVLNATATLTESIAEQAVNKSGKVDLQLTRMVEDSIYGYRRSTSLMGDGAVKFRDGVRLGNPLPVNAARLNYHAKKELRNNRVEEAQEHYEMAVRIDPRDGRAYLGLSKCAERRRDFKLAREFLRIGIANSASLREDGTPDQGANPFLLQALGYLEERAGHLSQAESLYIAAAKSRSYHAAAWVALGQLRTKKFRQGAAAGRVCYQAAERELEKAERPQSSHVYTAWASLEYKLAGDYRRAKQLFGLALKIDQKCSAAWLQLGVMEGDNENWKEAQLCFDTVLKFDQRNTRVLQAYAIMESKRPESDNRRVIGLYERALKTNPRDGGVFQPYALFVADLGDVEAARDL
jgi:tetratricopeptide (TPR) repeat protein